MSSTSGMASPTLTKAGAEAWKERREEPRRAGRAEATVRRAVNMFIASNEVTYNVVDAYRSRPRTIGILKMLMSAGQCSR